MTPTIDEIDETEMTLSSGMPWHPGKKAGEILVDSGYSNTSATVDTERKVWVDGRVVDRLVSVCSVVEAMQEGKV